MLCRYCSTHNFAKRITTDCKINLDIKKKYDLTGRFYGLVVGVPGYRSRGPGSIPGATRFSEK
jgi:hypothetical protein